MALSKKRRVVEKEDDVNGSGSDSNDEEMEAEEIPESEVQVDFEALIPDDSDYHGIKSLLQQLFRKAHISNGDLADTLIKQNYMGSVLKQCLPDDSSDNDDDDVFGVFSVIDITEKKNIDCVKQIRSYLLDNCQKVSSSEVFEELGKLLNDTENHVGFLISERFVNIPPQISVPLYESLRGEIQKAVENKKLHELKYCVLIRKFYEDKDNGPNKKEIIYSNAEEELLEEYAVLKFDFSISDEQDSAISGRWSDKEAEWNPMRSVVVFPVARWDEIVQKFKTEVTAPVT